MTSSAGRCRARINTLKGLKDSHLKVRTRFWNCLSYIFPVRSTTVDRRTTHQLTRSVRGKKTQSGAASIPSQVPPERFTLNLTPGCPGRVPRVHFGPVVVRFLDLNQASTTSSCWRPPQVTSLHLKCNISCIKVYRVTKKLLCSGALRKRSTFGVFMSVFSGDN